MDILFPLFVIKLYLLSIDWIFYYALQCDVCFYILKYIFIGYIERTSNGIRGLSVYGSD